MKKTLKTLFAIFIFFGFNSIVYASDQCYKMPGENNTVVVPSGYTAQCFYKYDSTKSNNNGQTNFDQISVEFRKESVILSSANSDGKIMKSFLKLDEIMKPSNYSSGTFNWDGLSLSDSGDPIKSSIYDKSINGCPKAIYWVNDTKNADKYVGFSSTENPSMSLGQNSKYAVYTLWMDTDDQIIFNSDSTSGTNIYSYPESTIYNEEVAKCDPNNIAENKTSGYGTQFGSTTDIKKDTLMSCTYYYALKSSTEDCHVTPVTFTYINTTDNGKSTLSVTSDYPGVRLENIEEKLAGVIINDISTYQSLNDYLVYTDGVWRCASPVYLTGDADGKPIAFGSSKYESFSTMYGKENIAQGYPDGSSMECPDKNYGVNFGSQVEINCDGIIGKDMLGFINKIFRWIQILAPIFVIIISSVELAGAVLQDDKDALKKAVNRFVKRLIIAVALFFIPLILSFVLNIFNQVSGANASTCGIGR